jgi:hypothetical protein
MTLTSTVVSHREVGTLDLYDNQTDVLHLKTSGAEERLCLVRVRLYCYFMLCSIQLDFDKK